MDKVIVRFVAVLISFSAWSMVAHSPVNFGYWIIAYCVTIASVYVVADKEQ